MIRVMTLVKTTAASEESEREDLTLILLFTTTPTFANSADPDQMASEVAIWSGSTLFVIQFVNLNENIIWCNLIGW